MLILALAVTVEALVEYGKSIGKLCMQGLCKQALTQLTAVAVSCALCLLAGADLYALLGVTFAWQSIGGVLTGVFASRGANYLSDLVKKLQGG